MPFAVRVAVPARAACAASDYVVLSPARGFAARPVVAAWGKVPAVNARLQRAPLACIWIGSCLRTAESGRQPACLPMPSTPRRAQPARD